MKITAIGALLAAVYASVVRYDNFKVLRFNPSNEAQEEMLQRLTESSPFELKIWKQSPRGVDILVPPRWYEVFKATTASIKSKVFIENVQDLIDEEALNGPSNFVDGASLTAADLFSNYQTTKTYVDFLLAQNGTTAFSIGTTYLGESIRGLKFGTGPKQIVYNGGIHAREWISPATTTYVTNFLLSNDSRAVSLRQRFTFHVIPVLNPDGYAYTQTNDRMWRKNRQPNPSSSCVGTDINRNFKFKWSQPGASSNPCSETFYGQNYHSTNEAFGLDKYIGSLTNVVSYFDIHSYGQYFLYNWGYTSSPAPYKDFLVNSTAVAVKAIKPVNGVTFQNVQSYTTGKTSGTTDDHFFSIYGIKYAMTIELRDTGNNGFVLPASQIVPSGKEMVEGLVAFWNYIDVNY